MAAMRSAMKSASSSRIQHAKLARVTRFPFFLLAPLAIGACADEPAVPAPAVPIVARVTAPPLAAVRNAGLVVASLRSGFRACYTRALDDDPTMAGRVTLGVTVAPDGTVAKITTSRVEGLSSAVVDCLVARLGPAQFDAPGPEGGRLQIPITFMQTDK
jgi:hypothetical protein